MTHNTKLLIHHRLKVGDYVIVSSRFSPVRGIYLANRMEDYMGRTGQITEIWERKLKVLFLEHNKWWWFPATSLKLIAP